ncbi:MAG: AP endonuclease, partial [Bacteroidia bacterium]|nr:AP endonuclease [Bacteroidia bacterium]
NAKRDSTNNLSPANEELFRIIDSINLKTTFWLSFSNNYFQDLDQEKSMEKATELVDFICAKAADLDCKVALYNHKGWFGSPYNQIKLIKALPQWHLKMVYNFHHAHDYINDFTTIARLIQPYLVAVNLNGMEKDGAKIHPLGEGNLERDMISILINEGFNGPWGLLGHVENEDVQIVLERNLHGLEKLLENH